MVTRKIGLEEKTEMNTPDTRGEAKKYGKVRTESEKAGSCDREKPK